jgi:PAS domain S-box-containing protein
MTVWALVGLLLGSGLAAWCADAVLYRIFFSADIPLSRCLIGLVPPDDFLDRLYIVVSVMLFILFVTLLRTRVKHRERYLRCLAKISSGLLASIDLDEVLPRVLRLLRGISGADHCYLYEVRLSADGAECATLRVEDYAPGVGPAHGAARLTDFDLRARGFGRWIDAMSAGKPIAGGVGSFPSSERGLLEKRGIRSLLALPLHVGGHWRGFIGFDARRPGVRWSEREINLLSTAASALSAALDRAAREEKISAARAEWERTFDAVPDLIAILDTRHRITRVNRAMAKRMGIAPGEAVGKTCYEAVHGLAQPPDFCPHAMLIRDAKEHTAEIREPKLNGSFLVSVSPFFDGNGVLAGSVHVARDITARKSLEEQLLHSQKMEAVGLLAGGVAHDFNNILAGIMGYTHLAKDSLAAGSELMNDMEAIERLARRGGDLTGALLAFAKKGEHRSEPVDPRVDAPSSRGPSPEPGVR